MNRFDKINALKKETDALSPQKEWNNAFLEKVKVDFTFYSNKLENNALNYGQTIRFLREMVQPQNVSLKDCLDIKNHYEILDSVFRSYKNKISEKIILHLHAKLMSNILQWQEDAIYSPGRYKTGLNYTIQSTGKLMTYLDPDLVPGEMKKLIAKTNNSLKNVDIHSEEKHPISIATYFHNRFLEIHPFEDGNGRIARIFLNQILIKTGFTPIFIKPTNRNNYLKLFETSNSENLSAMRNFFAGLLIDSLKTKKQLVL